MRSGLGQKVCLLCVSVLLALSTAGQPVHAQGNDSAVTGGQSAGGEGSAPAQEALVGAGTAEGATTGSSGPDAQSGGGEIEVPPLPSPETCSMFENSPAYEPCLELVLAEE